jgi:hypothetical protein
VILGTAIAVMAGSNQSTLRATRTPEQERAVSRGIEQANEIEALREAYEKANAEGTTHAETTEATPTTKLRPSAVSGSSGIPFFWNADTRAGCTNAEYGSGWCRASITRQCNATTENQEEEELSQAACNVLREVPETEY